MPGVSQTRAYTALLMVVVLWASFPALIKLALVDFGESMRRTQWLGAAASILGCWWSSPTAV